MATDEQQVTFFEHCREKRWIPSRRVPIFGFNQSRDDLCDSVPGRYAVRWVAIGGSLAEPQGTAAGITFDLNAHKCGRIVRKFYSLLDLTAQDCFSERASPTSTDIPPGWLLSDIFLPRKNDSKN